jgi:hypothetical protein
MIEAIELEAFAPPVQVAAQVAKEMHEVTTGGGGVEGEAGCTVHMERKNGGRDSFPEDPVLDRHLRYGYRPEETNFILSDVQHVHFSRVVAEILRRANQMRKMKARRANLPKFNLLIAVQKLAGMTPTMLREDIKLHQTRLQALMRRQKKIIQEACAAGLVAARETLTNYRLSQRQRARCESRLRRGRLLKEREEQGVLEKRSQHLKNSLGGAIVRRFSSSRPS